MPKKNFKRTSSADFQDHIDLYQSNAHIPMAVNPMSPHLQPFYHNRVRQAVELAAGKGEKPHILITGAIDHKTIQAVSAAVDKTHPGRMSKINLIDIYTKKGASPLERSISWAKENMVSANVRAGDARRLKRSFRGAHHAVVTDAFLQWFSKEDKLRVMKQWNRALKPQGTVITTILYKFPKNQLTESEGVAESEKYAAALKAEYSKSSVPQREISERLSAASRKIDQLVKIGAYAPFESIEEFEEMAAKAGFEAQTIREAGDNRLGFFVNPWKHEAFAKVILKKINS